MTTAIAPSLEEAMRLVASTEHLLVASDFDGTLAEIVNRPELAVAHPGAIAALDDLAALPATDAAVISGRTRADLALLTGQPAALTLVGGHGAEWSDRLDLTGAQEEALDAATKLVEEVAARHHGSLVERKQTSAVLHTRGIEEPVEAERAATAVREAAADIPGVMVLDGKQVVELTVTPHTKGSALATLRRRVAATAAMFVGDDLTDETAFEVLGPSDLAVKVGPGPTSALHRVATVPEVVDLLERLLDLRRNSA